MSRLYEKSCSNMKRLYLSYTWYPKRYMSNVEVKGPLNGIRICDLTRVLAGPYCTMVLGDMGAEIIKIERPGIGDDTRQWGPPFMGTESCYFLSVNRNKKSICVDITKEKGKQIIYKLIKKSDVFIENFLPGKVDSFGFSYNKLSKINPGLIYCSMSGYGAHGPDANKPGYDLVASAIGGMTNITGPKGGNPSRSGVAVTDILTGMYVHSAIITSLYEKEKTGKGKKIEASLLQSQVSMLTDVASSFLNSKTQMKRSGSAHPSIVPYQAFKTTDRDIVIAAGNDKQFQNLCKALNLTNVIDNPKYASNPLRVQHSEVLIQTLQSRIAQETSSYWLRILSEYDVPCALINNVQEALESEQIQSLGMIKEIEHPTAGRIKVTGPAVEYGDTLSSSPLRHPPLLGQHTTEIMKSVLKFDDSSINELLDENIIVQNEIR